MEACMGESENRIRQDKADRRDYKGRILFLFLARDGERRIKADAKILNQEVNFGYNFKKNRNLRESYLWKQDESRKFNIRDDRLDGHVDKKMIHLKVQEGVLTRKWEHRIDPCRMKCTAMNA